MFGHSRIRLLLAAVILCFGAAAVHISMLVVERQRFLTEVSRYNLAFVGSQTVNEILNFEIAITRSALTRRPEDLDAAHTRLDVLYNRLNVLKEGMITAFVARHPDQQRAIADLETALAEVEPLLDQLAEPATVARVLARLAGLDAELGRFAAAANNFGGEQVAEDQHELFRLHWSFSALTGGLVLCGLALVGALSLQNREIRDGHETLRVMSEDLRRAKDVAELGSGAKSRFLAGLTHELRTPLNAIIGFSELIAQESFGPLAQPRYRDYAADILKNGRQMYALINDILTMARLDAGRAELSLEPVQLASVVRAVAAAVALSEKGRGRTVSIEGIDEGLHLLADERALRQMMVNLLSNAVRFSDPATPVRITGERLPAGALEIAVIDRGIGMTAEEAQRALTAFHRIDSGMTRGDEGTGLGLAIVKGLVETHGGTLAIDSEPGAGCRAVLRFPKHLVLGDRLPFAA
jgi:signal transduction histidine kinase